MLNEADILESLRVCFDPELLINIVELGRVHSIQVAADTEAPGIDLRAKVHIELLPRHEDQDAMLAALVANRLLGIYDVSRAEVTVLESPPWSPDRMTDAARRELSRQRGLIQLG